MKFILCYLLLLLSSCASTKLEWVEPDFLVEHAPIYDGKIIIQFDSNKFKLKEQDKLVIKEMLKERIKDTTIHITGHSDTYGKKDYNEYLSGKRAESVASFLKDIGISEELLSVDWKGSDKPASKKHKENRRVEIEYANLQIVEKL